MSTAIFPIGNHKINFENRNFNELANEIKSKLDSIIFCNPEFLRLFALNWNNKLTENSFEIGDKNTQPNWTFYKENDYYTYNKDKYIEFEGSYNLNIVFDAQKIIFWYPPYRFCQWFEIEYPRHRDEWRKYLYSIVSAFGGDRVIYLADNSHPLDGFMELEGPFEAIESALFEKFGEARLAFTEVVSDYNDSYLIDRFEDINWELSVTFNQQPTP